MTSSVLPSSAATVPPPEIHMLIRWTRPDGTELPLEIDEVPLDTTFEELLEDLQRDVAGWSATHFEVLGFNDGRPHQAVEDFQAPISTYVLPSDLKMTVRAWTQTDRYSGSISPPPLSNNVSSPPGSSTSPPPTVSVSSTQPQPPVPSFAAPPHHDPMQVLPQQQVPPPPPSTPHADASVPPATPPLATVMSLPPPQPDLSALPKTLRDAAVAIRPDFALELIRNDVLDVGTVLEVPVEQFQDAPFYLTEAEVQRFILAITPVDLSQLQPELRGIAAGIHESLVTQLGRERIWSVAEALQRGQATFQAPPFGLTMGKAIVFMKQLKAAAAAKQVSSETTQAAAPPPPTESVPLSKPPAPTVPDPIPPPAPQQKPDTVPSPSPTAASAPQPAPQAAVDDAAADDDQGEPVTRPSGSLAMRTLQEQLDVIDQDATITASECPTVRTHRFPLFGPTTAGKSTTGTFLVFGPGALLRVEEYGQLRYMMKDPKQGFRIGGGQHVGSCTKRHRWLRLGPNLFLDDIPGDMDTDALDRITNCAVKEHALHHAGSDVVLSPMLVFGLDTVNRDNGGGLRDLFVEFAGVFHGHDPAASRVLYDGCVTFILTKASGSVRAFDRLRHTLRLVLEMIPHQPHTMQLVYACDKAISDAIVAPSLDAPAVLQRTRIFAIDVENEEQRNKIIQSMKTAVGARPQDFYMRVPDNVQNAVVALDSEEHRQAMLCFDEQQFDTIAKSVRSVRRVSSALCVVPPFGLLQGIAGCRKSFFEGFSAWVQGFFLLECDDTMRTNKTSKVCDGLMKLAAMEEHLRSAMLEPLKRCAVCSEQVPMLDAVTSLTTEQWEAYGMAAGKALVLGEITRVEATVRRDLSNKTFTHVESTVAAMSSLLAMLQLRVSLHIHLNPAVISDALNRIDDAVEEALQAMRKTITKKFAAAENVMEDLRGLVEATARLTGKRHQLATEVLEEAKRDVRRLFLTACQRATDGVKNVITGQGEASMPEVVNWVDVAFTMDFQNGHIDSLLGSGGSAAIEEEENDHNDNNHGAAAAMPASGHPSPSAPTCAKALAAVSDAIMPQPEDSEQIAKCSQLVEELHLLWRKESGGGGGDNYRGDPVGSYHHVSGKEVVLQNIRAAIQGVFTGGFTSNVEQPWKKVLERFAFRSDGSVPAVTPTNVRDIEDAVAAFYNGGYLTVPTNQRKFIALVTATANVVGDVESGCRTTDVTKEGLREDALRFTAVIALQSIDYSSSEGSQVLQSKILSDLHRMKESRVAVESGLCAFVKRVKALYADGVKPTTHWARLKEDLDALALVQTCGSPKRTGGGGTLAAHQTDARNAILSIDKSIQACVQGMKAILSETLAPGPSLDPSYATETLLSLERMEAGLKEPDAYQSSIERTNLLQCFTVMRTWPLETYEDVIAVRRIIAKMVSVKARDEEIRNAVADLEQHVNEHTTITATTFTGAADDLVALLRWRSTLLEAAPRKATTQRCLDLVRDFYRRLANDATETVPLALYESIVRQMAELRSGGGDATLKAAFDAFSKEAPLLEQFPPVEQSCKDRRKEYVALMIQAIQEKNFAEIARLYDEDLASPKMFGGMFAELINSISRVSKPESMMKYATAVEDVKDRLPEPLKSMKIVDWAVKSLQSLLEEAQSHVGSADYTAAAAVMDDIDRLLSSAPMSVQTIMRESLTGVRQQLDQRFNSRADSVPDRLAAGDIKGVIAVIVELDAAGRKGATHRAWASFAGKVSESVETVRALTESMIPSPLTTLDKLCDALKSIRPYQEALRRVPTGCSVTPAWLQLLSEMDKVVRDAEGAVSVQSKALLRVARGRDVSLDGHTCHFRFSVLSDQLGKWPDSIARFISVNARDVEGERDICDDIRAVVQKDVAVLNTVLQNIADRRVAAVNFNEVKNVRANTDAIRMLADQYETLSKRQRVAAAPDVLPPFSVLLDFPAAVEAALTALSVKAIEALSSSTTTQTAGPIPWVEVGKTHALLNAAKVQHIGVAAYSSVTDAVAKYVQTTGDTALENIMKQKSAKEEVVALTRAKHGHSNSALNPSEEQLRRIEKVINGRVEAVCRGFDVAAPITVDTAKELARCLDEAYQQYKLAPALGNESFVHNQLKGLLEARKQVVERVTPGGSDAFFSELNDYLCTLPSGPEVVNAFKTTYFVSVGLFNLPTRSIADIVSAAGCQTEPKPLPAPEDAQRRLTRIRDSIDLLTARAMSATGHERDVVQEVVNRLQHPSAGYLAEVPSEDDVVQLVADVVFVHWFSVSPKEPNGRHIKTHDVQIFAMLRLLGWDYGESWKATLLRHGERLTSNVGGLTQKIFRYIGLTQEQANNHLVEIPTGEGKSVVVGLTAAIHAVRGKTVHCVCYSECLCRRDEENFLPLMKLLGVEGRVKYQTVETMCEGFVGQLRDAAVELLTTGSCVKSSTAVSPKDKENRVLIIDEVDVFFTKQFMGNSYNAAAVLYSPEIRACIEYFWANRSKSIGELLVSEAATKARQSLPNAEPLTEWGMRQLACNVRKPEVNCTHVIESGKLIYVDANGNRNPAMSFPNRTVFQVLQEVEAKRMSPESLDALMGIVFFCGRFSYAELPKLMFGKIIGVTGTLSTLHPKQLEILSVDYNIHQRTYIRSLYVSQRPPSFFNNTFVSISDSRFDWGAKIVQRMRDVSMRKKSALGVYFENDAAMDAFMAAHRGASWEKEVHILRSTDDLALVNAAVQCATVPGAMTFFTAVHGRGLDFRFDEKRLPEGFSVLQTFYSDSYAEEVQIMGRCARQGKKGCYYLALCNEDLQRGVFHLTVPVDPAMARDPLMAARRDYTSKHVTELIDAKNAALVVHTQAMRVIEGPESIFNHGCQTERRVRGLMELNLTQMSPRRAVIMLLDGSGSMEGARWQALAKATKKYLLLQAQKRSTWECQERFLVGAVVCEKKAAIIPDLNIVSLEAATKVDISRYEVPGYTGARTDFGPGWVVVQQMMKGMLRKGIDLRFTLMWLTDGDEPGGVEEVRNLLKKYGKRIDAYHQYIYDSPVPPPSALENKIAFTEVLGVEKVHEYAASSEAGAAATGSVSIEDAFEMAAQDTPVYLQLSDRPKSASTETAV